MKKLGTVYLCNSVTFGQADQLSMKTFGKNPLITSSAVPSTELDNISAAEGAYSYVSQECTINVAKTIFQSSSSVAKSITCENTKSRAIACNVLGPFFTSTLIDELSESRFYSLSFDASNKGNCKTYPFAVQFFSNIGVKRGMVEFIEDSHETAADIYSVYYSIRIVRFFVSERYKETIIVDFYLNLVG
ncbi:unnamed protein product [Didymodactylos carnosus]|uniref:Uncharacterized protein n=1 Tax=Didymodactylos carnosus TaxID=1234261 RepID=A0A815DSR7_9BILA|nr:unnamed protein product [Didymodactylos carnosus]CAF1305193.1 unnamed protein product [Didymodactylos carnosus]CAF3889162.1 unnamed protein product [Didymodactylos carnosus]CAF4137335.1 unnamed protein product [Didymodactylos carnosus]